MEFGCYLLVIGRSGTAVRVVDTDAALPGRLRVVLPLLPDDAVPVSDVGPRLHRRALHRRLSPVPQGATVQDRQSSPSRRRHGHLLRLARRHTGELITGQET